MIDFLKIPQKYRKILLKNTELKAEFERQTKTKITVKDDVEIEGESVDVYVAKNVLKAFSRGFSAEDALKLMDDNYSIEIISLADFTSSENRIKIIASRIIGSQGKTKKYIERYTNTKIAVSGKTVSIIGNWDNVGKAREAIMMLIEGSSHKTVYRWLEQNSKVVDW
ncbi:MAG: KH domain-containing protein [Candidatus Aenigmarchaeota archaeon]|nr:KH domain-containing protein [Candidatus Aenigmarchaeota archaeon]